MHSARLLGSKCFSRQVLHKCLHEQGCAVEFRVHHEDSHGTVKCYSNRLTHDCGRSSQGERVCPSTGAVLRVARPPLHATMDMWLMEDEETAWPEPPENDSPGSSSSTSHQASACAILPLRAGQMTHTPTPPQKRTYDPFAEDDDLDFFQRVAHMDEEGLGNMREESPHANNAVTPKRRRLTRKQRPPTTYLPCVALPNGNVVEKTLAKRAPRWFLNKSARAMRAKGIANRRKKKTQKYDEVYREAYAEWNKLKQNERQQWIDKLSNPGVSAEDDEGPAGLSEEAPREGLHRSLEYSSARLFTFNGKWLLDDAEYIDVVKTWAAMPHILVLKVEQLPQIKDLFAEFMGVVTMVYQKYKCRRWSACLELSLKAEDFGRVHLHCFLERNCQEDKAWAKWRYLEEYLVIRGDGVSHRVDAVMRKRGRGRDRALTEGHYYCQAPKLGHVLHSTNCEVFKEIFPDSRMVASLWRTRKIATEAAMVQVLLTRDKAPSTLRMLEDTMSLEYVHRMESDVRTADATWKRCPFKPPSKAETEWARQFAVVALEPHMRLARAAEFCRAEDVEGSEALRRFKFLIYDGPSRMGKTELACAWFGSQYTMIVNAQECTTPNLRPLATGKFRAILFDEGGWALCWRNKAMLQASPRPVVLSQSQCNDRSYQVLLFRVPMIVCSNSFWDGCQDDEAKDWIKKNSVFVSVTEQVFESAAGP